MSSALSGSPPPLPSSENYELTTYGMFKMCVFTVTVIASPRVKWLVDLINRGGDSERQNRTVLNLQTNNACNFSGFLKYCNPFFRIPVLVVPLLHQLLSSFCQSSFLSEVNWQIKQATFALYGREREGCECTVLTGKCSVHVNTRVNSAVPILDAD